MKLYVNISYENIKLIQMNNEKREAHTMIMSYHRRRDLNIRYILISLLNI